jgi:SprT protein
MLKDFLSLSVFPDDILAALKKNLHNLPASSCADEDLMRMLRRYDANRGKLVLVEQVSDGDCFFTEDDRLFRRGKKLRKRFQCVEVSTGKLYLFSSIYEVKPQARLENK